MLKLLFVIEYGALGEHALPTLKFLSIESALAQVSALISILDRTNRHGQYGRRLCAVNCGAQAKHNR